ncbi:Pycsar system effector family protein [Streptomyces longwoodensis]|nr:Pycsar system effector family protein [Streptomyces longwoodensis]
MSAARPAPETDTDAQYVAERLLMTVREDMGRADVKASVLLSGALAVPALVLGRSGTPDVGPVWALALLTVGGILWGAGTLLLIAVIAPRTGTVRTVPGATFFADALTVTTPEALHRAVTDAGRDRVGWLLVQLQDASVILAAKYRWLRWSMGLLAAGLPLGLTPLALA